MIRTILNRWTDAVIWTGEAETVKAAIYAAIETGADLRGADLRGANLRGANLRGANLRGANLTDANLRGANLTDANLRGANLTDADLTGADLRDANLRGANLTGADLRGADLTGANLTGADLTGADLTGANLTGADLRGANLRGANLTGADLTGADLRGADLRGANLRGANLRGFRDDLWAVLSAAPAEAQALLDSLRAGRVEGSCYSGECACLVGTIANARGCAYTQLEGLTPDFGRPAELWFMRINQGDTPETNESCMLAAEWTEQWLTRMRATFGPQAVQ